MNMSLYHGISIITCTNRPPFMKQLLDNYDRQRYPNKELIIVLNNNQMNRKKYRAQAERYPNVRVYRLPEHISLGRCLNYGVTKARYPYIAKFDDDDYYAPRYLTNSMRTLQATKSDIVGKRAHYMYLQGKQVLLLRYGKQEQKKVSLVQGATLFGKRYVFQQVAFPDRNRGECVKFCSTCAAKGFKIYAGTKYDFAAIRRTASKQHTWVVSDNRLLSHHARTIPHVKNYKKYVSRKD